MNIHVTIESRPEDLPVLLRALGMLQSAPPAEALTGGETPVPVKRGPGRPPKSASAPAAEPAPPATPTVAVPVVQPAVGAEPAAPAGPKLTMKDLTTMVTETLDAVGQNPVRAVFKQFNAGKLSDVPPEKFTAFAAALTEARSMVQ